MNKKGFTLIEVLAVIAILAVISIIIIVKVGDSIKISKETLSKKQIDTLITATKKYMIEHCELLPEEDDTRIVTINSLIDNGIIDKDVINPKTNKDVEGCILVKYNEDYNQYEYEYSDDNNMCE